MNAVEIEEAVSSLAAAPFEPEAFPYAFLEAFGNKSTTLKRLKNGSSNQSDLGGVLQRNNIHLKVCAVGAVTATLTALRESPATAKYKAKFILATDGHDLQAENLVDGETIACDYPSFADHFGFFLPLAGITTVRQIRENAFDIKATGRLNRLYVELLKTNPDWDTAERRPEMNHFMARLIFCFFAEDTNIFHSEGLFTQTVAQMSASDAANTHEVLGEIFRAMATPLKDRAAAGIRNWANQFPYANGGLFGPPDPHPLTPSPRTGEGGAESSAPAPLSQVGRGVGGEGLSAGGQGLSAGSEVPRVGPHPLAPSPKTGQGGSEDGSAPAPLSQPGRGVGGEGLSAGSEVPRVGPHPLAPSPRTGEGGAESSAPAPLSQIGRGVGGEGLSAGGQGLSAGSEVPRVGPHPLAPSPRTGEGGAESSAPAPLSQVGRGVGGEGLSAGSEVPRVGPHPLTPSPRTGEGGAESSAPAPLSQVGRGAGGEGQYWEIPSALKKKMTEVARQFRKEPTPSEKILWQALRGRRLEGRKFRRQQPIGTFIVDFFCGAERLVVEVDGEIHESQQEADQQRQELLESLGLRVVRVTSELVETNLAQALSLIRQAFGPHPLAPSPRKGEGGSEEGPAPAPLSQIGRGAGGEGLAGGEVPRVGPHPLTPSPRKGEGGAEGGSAPAPLRGAGGEGLPAAPLSRARGESLRVTNFPHPLTPSPSFDSAQPAGEGGSEEGPAPAPPSQVGRGAGGEGLAGGEVPRVGPHPLTPSPRRGEGGSEGGPAPAPLSQVGRGAGGEGLAGGEVPRVGPHPLTPSPRTGEGGSEGAPAPAPLSQSGRGAGGEGLAGEGVPRFSRIARSYLLHVGNLDWTKINPDIFGSMIQAVADDEERGALGMHYTSVPNILKVLNPLFLDDLRAQLEAAGDNPRKLLNLRKRMARIRVFDPACGSGNFLVIAYKEMRAIEAEINRRRGEPDLKSEIPLTNFRGIEIRHFSCEVARLALIIAEYQCNVLYRGQREALLEFLPLKDDNWITCGNALRLDWLSICPPTGTGVKVLREDLDLFSEPEAAAEVEFENEGGETYICGNPPYLGSKWQTTEQKADLEIVFSKYTNSWKSLDYVSGWFMKAADYGCLTNSGTAFVATNSICQGIQVPVLWPLIFDKDHRIQFAHKSFKWSNLASKNAGVIVVVIGISRHNSGDKLLFSTAEDGTSVLQEVKNINAYLVPGQDIEIKQLKKSISGSSYMDLGNMPKDGGNLLLSLDEANEAVSKEPNVSKFIYDFVGSQEFTKGIIRRCIWIEDDQVDDALSSSFLSSRLEGVRKMRLESQAESTRVFADRPHRFKQIQGRGKKSSIVVPKVTSENRDYLPVGLLSAYSIVSDNAFALYDAPLSNVALIASRLHLVWIATVCGKMKTDFRYSNTLGWNTFPVPKLTEQNKADLTRCAEEILLAREHYFPATIADMYDPARMDTEFPLVRAAHDRNDEVLERIYIGRRFKNDTERLEKLFELYTKMTSGK